MSRPSWLFSDGDLSSALEAYGREAERKISGLPDQALQSEDPDGIVSRLLDEYAVAPLQLDVDGVSKNVREIDVDVSRDPHRHIRDRSRPHFVKGYEFTCDYRYSGDSLLWKLKPSTYSSVLPAATVHGDAGERDGRVVLNASMAGNPDPEQLTREIDRELETIQKYIDWQSPQVSAFNTMLEGKLRSAVKVRLDRLKSANSLAAALGAQMMTGAPIPPRPTERPNSKQRSLPTPSRSQKEHDLFISHASEDKVAFVRPLAQALRNRGLYVWLDETELKLGDSLRRTIDRGLTASRYGVVVLSEKFFAKSWPQYELDGLVAREVDGVKVILPIWLGIKREQIVAHSPTLADRLAADAASSTIDEIADQIASVVRS